MISERTLRIMEKNRKAAAHRRKRKAAVPFVILLLILIILVSIFIYLYSLGTIKHYVPKEYKLGYRCITVYYRDTPEHIIESVIAHDPGLSQVPEYLIYSFIFEHSDVNEYADEWTAGTKLYVPYTVLAGDDSII